MRKQRWGRPDVARRRRAATTRWRATHGLTPTQLALAFCYTKWLVASTIIGVTSLAQLDEDLDAWGTTLSPDLLAEIDKHPLGDARPGDLTAGWPATRHEQETPRQRNARPRRCCARTALRSPSTPTNTSSTAARSTAPQVLGLDPFTVVKTLVMQDQDAKPLLVLMHGNRTVRPRTWRARSAPSRSSPARRRSRNRHSGYLVGGTSPFGTRREMPVYVESSILELPRICINGGRRGYLVGIDPRCASRCWTRKPVHCALAE